MLIVKCLFANLTSFTSLWAVHLLFPMQSSIASSSLLCKPSDSGHLDVVVQPTPSSYNDASSQPGSGYHPCKQNADNALPMLKNNDSNAPFVKYHLPKSSLQPSLRPRNSDIVFRRRVFPLRNL